MLKPKALYSLALLLLLNGCQTGKPRTPQETGEMPYGKWRFASTDVVNAIIAWIATRTDMVNHVVSLAPWTTPGPVGAAWSTGWDYRAVILI
ncbi:hypothetical protein AADJ18_00110, partial [Erwinia amylovora]